jgi:hypothetical protein
MKYNTKQWLENVILLKGSEPWQMRELPIELQVRSEIKPLTREGILQLVKWEWIGSTKKQTWRVSPEYIARRNRKHVRFHTDSKYLFEDSGKSVHAMARARAYHGNEDLYVEVAVVKGELILNDIIRLPGVLA